MRLLKKRLALQDVFVFNVKRKHVLKKSIYFNCCHFTN